MSSKPWTLGLGALAAVGTLSAALLASTPAAQADVICQVQTGGNVTPAGAGTIGCTSGAVNGAQSNVLFSQNKAGVITTDNNIPATLQGFVQNTNIPVDFTSTTDALQVNTNAQGGNATIKSLSDSFVDNLSYYIPNPPGGLGFTELDTNLDVIQASGTVDFFITAVNSLGVTEPVFETGQVTLTNGANKFAFIASAGEVITKVEYTATNVSSVSMDVKQTQVNVAPIPGTPVPEPTSLALLGSALVGLGVLRRRRKNV